MGVGLPLGQVVTAVIVLFVVFAAVKGAEGVAHAAEKLEEMTGIDLGKTRLGAFAVEASGDGSMDFRFSVRGSRNDAELFIYRSHSPTPESEPVTPQFTGTNTVFHAVKESAGTGKKLKDILGNSKLGKITCPDDAACEDPAGTNFETGWYWFIASLKKDGTEKDRKEFKIGIYDEPYLENLNSPVKGCFDEFDNCNVVECKKKLVDTTFSTTASPKLASDLNRIRKDASAKFQATHAGSACGDYNDAKRLFEKSDTCSPVEINDLNNRLVRARLLEAAFLDTSNDVSVSEVVDEEDDYALYPGRITKWVAEAMRLTASCSYGYNGGLAVIKVPKGAQRVLAGLNWAPIGSFKQNSNLMVEAQRIIDEDVKPVMKDLKAEAFADRHLALSWNVLIGKKRVGKGSYNVKVFHTRWPGPLTAENQRVEITGSPFVVSGKQLDGSLRSSYATSPMTNAGKYDFEISIHDKPDATDAPVRSYSTTTGFFDEAYLRTYPDVYKLEIEKMNFQSNLEAEPVKMAMSKITVSAGCKYEKSGSLIFFNYELVGCTPEDVDAIWKGYLLEHAAGIADDYDCIKPLSAAGYEVCSMGSKVVKKLQDLEWSNIVPAGHEWWINKIK